MTRPTRNDIAHVVRNAILVLKGIAKKCRKCHGECPLLIELSKADSELKELLTDYVTSV